jgi:hypothetical protein
LLKLFQNFLTAVAIFKVNVRQEDEVEKYIAEIRSIVIFSGKTPCGQEVKPTFFTSCAIKVEMA